MLRLVTKCIHTILTQNMKIITNMSHIIHIYIYYIYFMYLYAQLFVKFQRLILCKNIRGFPPRPTPSGGGRK
jgi:hypothetical protein